MIKRRIYQTAGETLRQTHDKTTRANGAVSLSGIYSTIPLHVQRTVQLAMVQGKQEAGAK